MRYQTRNRVVGGLVGLLILFVTPEILPVTVGAAVIAGVIGYGIGSFIAAWAGRTWHWYNRGSRQRVVEHCPNCNARRYRTSGTLILKCHHCGWKPGLPVLRWLQHSVVTRQFRVSLGKARILSFLFIICALTFAIALVGGTGIFVLDSTADGMTPAFGDSESGSEGGVAEAQTPETASTPQAEANPDAVPEINHDRVQANFATLLSQERQQRQLPIVTRDAELRAMAVEHSSVMAEIGEIGHVQPDGSTIKDRYQERGLLPECRIDVRGSDEFYPGAENVAQTWVGRSVTTENGTVYIEDEGDLAAELLRQWMTSPPHRKPMLLEDLDNIGLGLTITETGKVYAALEMC